MTPCWSSSASLRPSFSSLACSLESLLGEDGLSEYQEMYRSYMARLPILHRLGTREETPLPPYQPSPAEGYIQLEAVAGINKDSSPSSYIKMENNAGYSRHTTTPEGYIALMDISNK